MRALIALALLAGVACAQDLTGNWQGTLTGGARELRTIVRLAKNPAGDWAGAFYSIDQTPQPIPITQVSLAAGTFKFAVPAAGANYEGRLSTDGNTITGNWTQGQPVPLVLTRATPQTAWEIPAPPAPPKQMVGADPSFSVSTIKPSDPNRPGKGITFRGQDLVTINTTIGDMMTLVYGVHPKQIVGMPGWAEAEKFDVTARPEAEGQPTEAQLKVMMKKLLAERFQLKLHTEQREMNAYTIGVAKGGPKLTENTSNPNGLPGFGFRGLGVLQVTNSTLAFVASGFQSNVLDRPVVDRTGLTGRYDFALTWTPDEFQFPAITGQRPAAPKLNGAEAPNLFQAFEEQLGLKLETGKAQVDVLVVDKVEKPGEN
jgi:uncharacterized protein (TIGR03435 family)